MGILQGLSYHIQEELIIALTLVLYAVARLIGIISKRIELGENITISVLGKDIVRVEDIHRTQQAKEKIPVTGE
jgi:hypothetical protein